MKINLVDRIKFKDLGSPELRDQVFNDIEYILETAVTRGLIPKIMVVGSFFIHFGSVETVMVELGIKSWHEAISDDSPILKDIVNTKVLNTYTTCEGNFGKFSHNKERGIDIYFDPDEEYISLRCIDPTTKSDKPECSTKDGYMIVTLFFEEKEILPSYLLEEPIIH